MTMNRGFMHAMKLPKQKDTNLPIQLKISLMPPKTIAVASFDPHGCVLRMFVDSDLKAFGNLRSSVRQKRRWRVEWRRSPWRQHASSLERQQGFRIFPSGTVSGSCTMSLLSFSSDHESDQRSDSRLHSQTHAELEGGIWLAAARAVFKIARIF